MPSKCHSLVLLFYHAVLSIHTDGQFCYVTTSDAVTKAWQFFPHSTPLRGSHRRRGVTEQQACIKWAVWKGLVTTHWESFWHDHSCLHCDTISNRWHQLVLRPIHSCQYSVMCEDDHPAIIMHHSDQKLHVSFGRSMGTKHNQWEWWLQYISLVLKYL